MRIMSFNLRGAYWQQDGANYWPKRAALNVATIKRYAPDLIGFQEFQDGNYAVYQRELPEYRWSLGPRYGNAAPFEYPAIAWNPQHYRLVGAGGFWLSETPHVHSASWDTDCIRAAQWLRLQPNAGGATFILLNTHLDHISEPARLEGARLIVHKMQGRFTDLPNKSTGSEPIVITGDFNCDPGTPTYEVFCAAGYTDSFLAVGEQSEHSYTYHGFQGQQYQLKDGRSERIDWILVRDMQIQAAQIIRDQAPPLYPSDHYPVVADVSIS